MDTVIDLLRHRADHRPDRLALAFRDDAASTTAGLTHAEWVRRAASTAAVLEPGTRVVLMLPPGAPFFAGLAGTFMAGACAVPVPPPVTGMDPFLAIARDAEAGAVITDRVTAVRAREAWDRSGLRPIRWLDAEETTAGGPAADGAPGTRRRSPAPDELAVLQYTSGSTGRPKGVAITHEVLAAWLEVFSERVALPPDSAVVTWAPVHQALGLTVSLMALAMDGSAAVLTPQQVLADPVTWLRTISGTGRPTFSGAPPFAYQLCVDAVPPERRTGLDLARWEVALIGSERIRPRTLDAFTEAYREHGFRSSSFFPSYGMTEIMMASGHRGPAEPVRVTVDAPALERRQVRPVEPAGGPARVVELVGSGAPGAGVELLIVDPERRIPAGDGAVGELWVRGPVVAREYWQRPEATEEAFAAFLADGAGPYFRTGDLAFFHCGELVVCGRIGELIIVRGRNLLPQDIESTVQNEHAAVAGRPVAAFATEGTDADLIVIIAEADPAVPQPDRLAAMLARAVTRDHDVEVHHLLLVAPGGVPQTPSGKIRRTSCRRAHEAGEVPFFASTGAPSAPSAEVEPATVPPLPALLAALPPDVRATVAAAEFRSSIGGFLGLGAADVAVDVPLVELGLDSLRMIRLRAALARRIGAEIALGRLAGSTVDGLVAALLDGELTGPPAAEVPAAGAHPAAAAGTFEPFPLTELQQAYLAGSSDDLPLGGVSTHYYAEFEGPDLDVARLRDALEQVVRRHGMLRAVVSLDGTQRVLRDAPPMPLPLADLSSVDPSAVGAHLERTRAELSHRTRPAGAWPLLEVRATRLPGGSTRVHVSVDLLVVDLWSLGVLSRDWRAAYEAPDRALPAMELSFRDYLSRVRPAPDDPALLAAEQYWLHRVDDLPEGPQLPMRSVPAAGGTTRFHRRAARLDRSGWHRIERRAAAHGVTGTVVLIATYAAVLGAWSRTSRFTLSVPTFTREPVHGQVDEVIGDATAVTLLEIDLRSAGTLPELARHIQHQLWQDLEHRAHDGVRVLREIALRRAGAELFAPVVFAAAIGQSRGGVPERPLAWLGEQVFALSQTPQVLLDHQVLEDADGLVYNWDSVDDHFVDGVLDDMFAAYGELLGRWASATDHWGEPLHDLVPPGGLRPARTANATDGPRPDGLLHEPLLARAAATPEAPAVIGVGRTLSFGELRAQAVRIAHRLRELGVGPGDVVGVLLPKDVEQVVAVLAVVLAGGAYLPVDPALPRPRRDRLLERGGCGIVLHRAAGAVDLPGVRTIEVDLTVAAPDGDPPIRVARPEDLAYIIFTSGSTGDPKGVAVSHRAALNTCTDVNERFDVGPEDRVLGLSSLSFDLSVYDIFGVLGAGGALVLPAADTGRSPDHWLELIDRHGITLWNSVPALMAMLVEYLDGATGTACANLRLVLLSGDWVPVGLPARIRSIADRSRIVSLGGATEAAIWSICFEIDGVDPAWDSIPYGRPMRNQRFHVLDDRLHDRPVHAVGELYIGGVGLAEGYHGDPERTAERFVRHPRTGERLYRTGDLGRWRPDGTIEFLGREDQQVKVGGYRIELGEIEAALGAHPDVLAAAVTAPGDRHHRRLVAHVVPAGPGVGPEPLRAAALEHLTSVLPGYMVPSLVQVIDALPLTGNGKVDRAALIAGLDTHPATDSREPVDEALVASVRSVLAAVLGVRDDAAATDVALSALGVDSLRAIELRNVLGREFGVRLPIRTLLDGTLTPTGLAAAVRQHPGHSGPSTAPGVPARPAERFAPFALTDLQHAYVVGRAGDYALSGTGSRFAVEFDSPTLDPHRLAAAFDELVRRHDMLRVRILADGTQQVPPALPPPPAVHDLHRAPADQVAEHLARTRAELERGRDHHSWPLYDLRLTALPDGVTRVHLGMDLLVADVWSIGIVLREWQALYGPDRADLPPLSLTFRDYLAAADATPEPENRGRARDYWIDRVPGLPPGPELPLRRDPPAGAPVFHRRGIRLPAREWAEVRAQAAHRGLTPNAVLLASYAAVLARWSARPRFCLTVPTFGRRALHHQVGDIVGDFTSVTLLEVDAASGDLADLAACVQERLVLDLENAEFSGLEVLRELARRGTRTDAFAPVVFTSALGQGRDGRGDLALGWLGEQVHGISQTPQVLLDLQVYERDGELIVHWDAVEELFEPRVLDEMFGSFEGILHRLACGWWDPARVPHQQVDPVRSDDAADAPAGLLHEHVLDQCRARPDTVAVVDDDGPMTYGELGDRTAELAARLREAGVPAGRSVAVCLPPGSARVVATLAVLIAGGAYVVLEPDDPDRAAVLREARCVATVAADGIIVAPPVGDDPCPPGHRTGPDGTACLVGSVAESAGELRTVALSHRLALATIAAVRERHHIGPGDRVLGRASAAADPALTDVLAALASGATALTDGPGPPRTAPEVLGLLRDRDVTVWITGPRQAEAVADVAGTTTLPRLRSAVLAGERIRPQLPGRLREIAPDVRSVAVGGPPGTGLWSWEHPVDGTGPDARSVPLGRPLPHQCLHVLDDDLRERPIEVPGELHVAGLLPHPPHGAGSVVRVHADTGRPLLPTGLLARRRRDGTIEPVESSGPAGDRPAIAGPSSPSAATGGPRPLDPPAGHLAGVLERLRDLIGTLVPDAPAEIAPQHSLQVLGVDSLRAIQLRNAVEREWDVLLPMRVLLGGVVLVADVVEAVTAELGAGRPAGTGQRPALRARPSESTRPFPLTELQQAYVIGRSRALQLGGVSTYFHAECAGGLDPDRLVRAFQGVVDRHPTLRSTVTDDGRQQVLDDLPPVPVARHDLRGAPTELVEDHLLRLRGELAHRVLPLGEWPLFDLQLTLRDDGGAPALHVHFGCDLLLADVWSIGLLLREWQARYEQVDLDLPPLEVTFRDYLAAAEQVDGGRAREAERYWGRRLATLPDGPDLPVRPAPPGRPPRFDRRDFGLERDRWSAVKAMSADRGLTPNAVLVAVLSAVVGTWSRSPHFLLNLPTFNRFPLHDQVDQIIGDFTSITVLEVDGTAHRTVADAAAAIQARLVEDLDHGAFSGLAVLRELARTRPGRPVAAPVVFTSALGQAADGRGDLATGWLGQQVFGRSQTPQVLLDNQVYESDGRLVVHWDLVAELFPDGVVDEMAGAFATLLDRIAAPDGLVAPLTVTHRLTGGPGLPADALAAPLAQDPEIDRAIRTAGPTARLRVLDEHGWDRPAHVVGELCVAGTGEGGTAPVRRTGRLAACSGAGTIEPATGRAPADAAGTDGGAAVRAALEAHPAVELAVTVPSAVAGPGTLLAIAVPARPRRWGAAAPAVDPALFPPDEAPTVLFDEADRVEFKLARHGVRPDLTGLDGVRLASGQWPDPGRSSRRRFAERPVPLDALGTLLSRLAARETPTLPKYRYASAGNSYGLQTYLLVAPGGIAGLAAGSHYHDPVHHRLVPVEPGVTLPAALRWGVDQQALDTAAFLVVLVAARDAVEPLYGRTAARDLALLEAGSMMQLLEDGAAEQGIALCQLRIVGGATALHDPLRLPARHEVVHALIGGAVVRSGDRTATGVPVPPPDAQLRERLRRHLADRLAADQLPQDVLLLDDLPRTGSGEIDRAALHAWAAARAASTAPPADRVEAVVARVLAEVLQVPVVGVDTGFFESGADSVSIVRAHRLLQDELGRRFPLTDLFEHPTVRGLSAALAAEPEPEPAPAAVPTARRRVRQARAVRHWAAAATTTPAAGRRRHPEEGQQP